MIEGKKDFLTVQDFSKKALLELIELAIKMKHKKNAYRNALKDKKLAMLFEKSSTRTRVSFEMGMVEMGGYPAFISTRDSQLGRGEPISDTAQVLSRYVDGIMIRTFGHDKIRELAGTADIPVINGLTDSYHPCQAMADLMTIYEHKKRLNNLRVAYVGDGNNVAHSLGLLCSKLGIDFAIASPKGYEMDPIVSSQIYVNAKENKCGFIQTQNPVEAVTIADVIYTDVWASMGQEAESVKRRTAFKGYTINNAMAKHANQDYIFMHCLPAHRGEEVAEEVIDSPHSVIFDEAENRLHAQKAILFELMRDK